MLISQLLLYSALPVIPVVGFVLARLKRYNRLRAAVFAVVLFAAFLFDLLSTSFCNDRFDTGLKLLVALALSELFFRLTRFKRKGLFITALLTGALVFFWINRGWITAGPQHAHELWQDHVLTQHSLSHKKYRIKKRTIFVFCKRSYDLVLFRQGKAALIERELNHYNLPEGYENADYSFAWKDRTHPLQVQIIGNTDTLWTLEDTLP